MTRRRLVLVLAAAVLAGCAVAPAKEPLVVASLIEQLPLDVPHRTASAQTLVVFPPEARPALDTTQMAYSVQAHQLAYYAHHQWAETPPQMLLPLLVRTLEKTGAFHAVASPPFSSPSLSLRTEVVEFVQDYGGSAPVVRVGLRVQLADDRTRAVLGTREIAVREAMAQKGPEAGVVAANKAVAKALRDVAQFAVENAP